MGFRQCIIFVIKMKFDTSATIPQLTWGATGHKHPIWILYKNRPRKIKTKIIGHFDYRYNKHKNKIRHLNLNFDIK